MARRATARLIVGTVRRRRAALLRGTALQAATALVFAAQAHAQPAPTARPAGGQVVAGSASIGQTTAQTTVNQASQRAAIDWRSFDVGSQHTVQFNQPSASAVALNRVTGPDPSQIAGQIIANGNIIITNPSGVMFHQGAQVNANSLVVSAPGITNQNFMAGRMIFDQAPKPGATVSNAGTITVKETGLAALVAPRVVNSGVINARLGRAVLAGAEAHTIDLYGDGLVSIDVTKSVTQVPLGPDGGPVTALVTNTGTVIADGGTVQITAKAVDGIVQNLVQAGGRIQANTVGNRSGRVAIAGVGGSVRIEGQLAADGGAGQPGGQVAVNASDTVTVARGARISAGGYAGGGTVALGTTPERALAGRTAALTPGAKTPGTPAGTARQVVVEAGSTVSADGLDGGSGGTVGTLSTQSTRIDGLLTARGGPIGGDGGVIEASSDGVLALNQAPDAGAPAGKGGTIYLDPFDLIVGTGTPAVPLTGGTQNPAIAAGDPPATGTSYIAPATLEQASQNGAVTISLAASHDLTVQETVNLARGTTSLGGATGGASLSLHADHDLDVLANLTLGNLDPNGNTPRLTLDAGHNLNIGPVSGNPAVTISAFGTITMTTTAALADPNGSSITVRANSVIDTQGGIVLQASNRVDIGSNVQMTAGPNFGFSIGNSNYSGINVAAGSDITVASNSALTARTQVEGFQGLIQLDAGGNISLGLSSRLDAGGPGSTISLFAGDNTPSLSNANAPAPSSTGSVNLAFGASLGGASSIDVETGPTFGSGADGQINLAAGSVIRTTDLGNVFTLSGTAGSILGGTVDGGAGGLVTLNSSGAVTQPASGAIIAADLLGNALSYDLRGDSNQIAQIGTNFAETLTASTGDITLVDSIPLTVGGSVDSTGGGIQVPSGRTITLRTDSLTIGLGALPNPATEGFISSTLYAPSGAVVIQPFSAGRPVELASGAKTAGALSVTRSELDNVVADRLQLGSTTAGALTVGSAGTPLDMSSTGGGTGFTELDLVSGRTIAQASGSALTVPTLTASGTAVTLLETGNQITTLGASSASAGGFSIADGAPLTIAGAVTAAADTIFILADQLAFNAGGSLAASTVQLAPLTPTRPIELVQTTPNAGRLSVTQAMLNSISTSALALGQAGDTGGIVIGNAGDTIVWPGIPTLSLIGSGAVTEGAGASLAAQTLIITSGGGGNPAPSSITLGGPNQIGVITAESRGTITFSNAAPLRVDVLSAPGTIDVSTTVGDLTVARTSATFDDSDNAISGGQSVRLAAAGNLSFAEGSFPDSLVRANVTLTLVAGGAITQSSGALVAGTLSGSAGSAALTQAGNQISSLGAFATAGDFSLVDRLPLTIAGTASVGTGHTLSLVSDRFQVTPGGGLSAPGGVVALAPLTPGQAFSLSGFVPSGAITASTLRVGNDTTGDITISGTFTLDTVGTLDLRSAGAITEGGITEGGSTGGRLQVASLTGSAGSATLDGQNTIGALAGFTTGTSFTLANTQSLAVTGPLQAGTAANLAVTGDLTLTADMTAPTLTLQATGAITQTTGVITTTALTGGADLVHLDSINQIDSVGAFSLVGANLEVSAPSAFLLRNGRALTLTGNITAAAGNVVLDTSASPTGDVTVATTENTPGGDFIIYSGRSVTVATGASIAASGAIFLEASFGANSLTASGAVNVNGALSATDVFLGAGPGGINLAGNVTASRYVALRGEGNTDPALIDQVRGPIAQTAGTISAPNLSARGTSVLLNGGNRISNLGLPASSGDVGTNVATTGDFSVASAVPLTVARSVTVSTGHTISLASDSIQLGEASQLVAPGGVVALAPFTPGTAFALGSFVPTGDAIVADTLRVGSGTTGDISISGVFNLSNVNTLDLRSAGAITEGGSNGGSVQVASLTGSAGSATLDGQNAIGALAGFTSGTSFTLANTRGLAVTGPVQAGTTASLAVAGDLALAANITVPTLTLSATGAITQAGSLIQATTLASLTASSASLTGNNQIGTLGAFSVGTAFTLNDATGLIVAGPGQAPALTLNAGGSVQLAGDILNATSLTVNAAGSVVQTGGTLNVGTLAGTAVGLAQFGGTGTANVGTLGPMVLTGSTLSLIDSVKLTVAGPLVAGTVTLSAPGAMTLAGGRISSDNATLSVTPQNGVASLMQNGTTTVASNSGGTGTLRLVLPASGGALTLQNLDAPGVSVALDLGTGAAAGALNVAALQVNGSGGSASLTGSVAGQGGPTAATAARISPSLDVAYKLNGCIISAAICNGSGNGGGGGTSIPGGDGGQPPFEPIFGLDSAIAVQTPKSFLDTELGNTLKTNLFTADLITIGIIRDPTDPELLLPNISDRDY